MIHQTGLSSDQIATLSNFATGFYSVREYIKKFGVNSGEHAIRGIGLGLRDKGHLIRPYKVACRVFDLAYCMDFQRLYGISYISSDIPKANRKNAENQMRNLVSQGLPFTFFVPPNMTDHNRMNTLTSHEMWWLIRNPNLAPETAFVFGLNRPQITPFLSMLAKVYNK